MYNKVKKKKTNKQKLFKKETTKKIKKTLNYKEAYVKEKVSWLIISKLYFYRKKVKEKSQKEIKKTHRKKQKSNHKIQKYLKN